MKIERWQTINDSLIVDEASDKAIIVKDKDKKILKDLQTIKTLIETDGKGISQTRTKT